MGAGISPSRWRWRRFSPEAPAVCCSTRAGTLPNAHGLAAIDPHTAQALAKLTGTIQLMGGQSVLIGMRPALIQELVHARVDFAAIHTERDLPSGLRLLRHLLDTAQQSMST